MISQSNSTKKPKFSSCKMTILKSTISGVFLLFVFTASGQARFGAGLNIGRNNGGFELQAYSFDRLKVFAGANLRKYNSFSTRLGAAVRQAGDELVKQTNYRKLLLIISDGEPSDIDVDDNEYLVEDAKYAVKRLAYNGIDVFCVGVESESNKNLSRIFGNKNYVIIKSASELPKKLPLIYLTLSR